MKKIFAIFALCFAVFAANAQQFLLQESFDESTVPAGWATVDADGDGFNWGPSVNEGNFNTHTGAGCITSASYDFTAGALTPDNWLITPAIAISANAQNVTLSWWVAGQDPDFAVEHYAVYVSTTGAAVADFTSPAVYEGDATGEYVNLTVDLTSYAGQNIYIGFRHYNVTDMFYLNLDDIEITYNDNTLANAPTNFVATADPSYALSVDLSWTNPSTTLGGDAITAINSIELYRGATLVNSFANPTVGGNMTYTDNTMTEAGAYTYEVYAVTNYGNGLTATQTVLVGHICPITLEMVDSYGDGWNGASIEIYDANNNLLGSYTLDAAEQTEEIMLPVGVYTFAWVAGSYDYECSFTITDPYGIPLYTSSGTMEAGTFYTLNQTCEPPAMYTVSGVVTSSVDNTPIANATVTVSGMNGGVLTTDANGAYTQTDVVSILPYSITVEAEGFNGAATSFNSLSGDTTINFSLTAPQFAVTYEGPIEVTTNYGINAQFSPITVMNEGNGTLTWGTGVEFVRDGRSANTPMSYSFSQSRRVKENTDQPYVKMAATATATAMPADVDYSPYVATINGTPTRAAWDFISSFEAPSAGQQGIATDGNFIYTCSWQSTPTAGYTFIKYDLDGNMIEGFDITGVTGCRDMTYDGTYFYVGAGSSTLYQLDLASHTLVSTINTSVSTIRHCSYDSQNDGFWVGNWDDLYLIDRSGNIVVTAPAPESAYGSAYDNYSAGGPYLWLFTQPNSNAVFVQYDIANNTFTNTMIDITTIDAGVTTSGLSGGAFTTDALVSGKFVMMANTQQDPNHISVFELADAGWMSAAPGSGSVAPGQSTDITLNFNGSYPVGDYNANLTISSRNPFVGDTVIPIIFHIVAPECDAPTNLQVVPTDYEYMALTWDAPADVTDLVEYRIYRNNSSNYLTSTTNSYDDHVSAGHYCYYVKAYYENGDEQCLSYSTDTVCEDLLRCNPDSMCAIRVAMTDSYGDGWNGASIQFYVNGEMISTFTCAASSDDVTVDVCPGELSFVWVAGGYDSECSFMIYNALNAVLYNGSTAPSAGTFLTYNLDCQNLEEPDAISESEKENIVAIHPNPASTVLNVHAENCSNVEIINFLGQVVYSANVTENDFQINVSNLSNGVYFIRLKGETTTTQKFIKK